MEVLHNTHMGLKINLGKLLTVCYCYLDHIILDVSQLSHNYFHIEWGSPRNQSCRPTCMKCYCVQSRPNFHLLIIKYIQNMINGEVINGYQSGSESS